MKSIGMLPCFCKAVEVRALSRDNSASSPFVIW
jgi:hypothetical protein